MNSITVFCGSGTGTEKIYCEQAYQLGKTLARDNIGLVYGGSKTGLMGALADGVIENKGKVTGVLPGFLRNKELAHEGLTELILVDTMHQRKARMHELSDGCIALPGGLGTLEELFEIMTWAQLGLHQKPVALLNVNGFYDELLSLLRNMVHKGFLRAENRERLIVSNRIDDLLYKMHNNPAVASGSADIADIDYKVTA